MQTIIEATESAIKAADHLLPVDAAAVAVLRLLAERVEIALSGDPDAPFDNVSPSLYLKMLAELGLTPAARQKLGIAASEPPGRSALAQLRAISGGRDGLVRL